MAKVEHYQISMTYLLLMLSSVDMMGIVCLGYCFFEIMGNPYRIAVKRVVDGVAD